MKINSTRLQQHFEAMSLIGKIGETGTCRPAHTELEKQGLVFIMIFSVLNDVPFKIIN